MPRRWHQVGGSISAGDGGKQARSPGRARRKPLKPLGNAGCIWCDRGDYARMLFYFACEAAGASRARHSLRPLMFQMAQPTAKLGRIASRECGGVSVRQLIRESAVVMAGLDLACPGHPRLSCGNKARTWITGTSPVMTPL